MNNPRALRSNIFTESLADETILYDKTTHKAHSLNKTVAKVWESADGQKSVDEITGVLHHSLGLPEDRSIVLLALEELEAAGLLEVPVEVSQSTERVLRRQLVTRRLALAGASAALVPFVASVLAPTPAMASSGTITAQQYAADANIVLGDIATHPFQYLKSPTAQQDEKNALVAGSHGNYATAITDFDGVLQALGLPPL